MSKRAFWHTAGVRCRAERRARTVIERLETRAMLSAGAISGIPQWSFEGPDRIITGYGDQVGAVEALAVHPTNGGILYAASVNGGIWKTQNAHWSRFDGVDNNFNGQIDELAERPTWTPLTDAYDSLSMGDITFDPLDPTHQTLWASHANLSSGGNVGGPLGGLLRTTDGGLTWTEFARATFQRQHVRSVLPTSRTTANGQIILATSTNGGVFRSEDGAATWDTLSGASGVGDGIDNDGDSTTDEAGELNLPEGGASEVIVDPSNSQRYFVSIPEHGVFRSTDSGATWEVVNTGLTDIGGTKILLSMHHNNGAGTTILYAAMVSNTVVDGRNAPRLTAVYRSANVGNSWVKFTNTPQTGEQGFLHTAMVADPNNANLVFAAGQAGVFRGDFSTGNWEGVNGAGANNTYSHADAREMLFDSTGQHIVKSDDGGVYRLRNPHSTASSPYPALRLWESLNQSLETTEFWSVAYDPVSNVIFGGTQDNVSIQQFVPRDLSNSSFRQTFAGIHGGDGNTAAVEILGNSAIRYTMGNNIRDFRRRTYGIRHGVPNRLLDDDNVMLAAPGSTGTMWSGLHPVDQKLDNFDIFPYVTNTITPSRLMLGTRNGLYESQNHTNGTPSRGDIVVNIMPTGMGAITALDYGGRQINVDKPDVLYVGAIDLSVKPIVPQLWVRSSMGAGLVRRNSYPGEFVRDVVMDPLDWRTAYVLDWRGRIWRTTDAGATAGGWTEVTGNLTNFTSRDVWSLEMLRIGGTPVLLAAGQGGVYRRINPAIASTWAKFGRDLPNVTAMDVHYDATDKLLIAGTFGRGAWSIEQADTYLPVVSTLTITGDQDFVNQNDQILLAKNPRLENRLDIYANSLGGQPTATVEFSAVESIAINTLTGNDFIRVDYLPEATSLVVHGGGGDDVIWSPTSDLLSNAVLYGDDGTDWFAVMPATGGEIQVVGGQPAAPTTPADSLRVLPNGTTPNVIPGPGADEGIVQTTGRELIRYHQTESVLTSGSLWRPDRLEPNDSRVGAFNLVAGDQTQVGLSLHGPGNDDWYRWNASATEDLVVELFFEHDLGDLDMTLHDASGTQIASAVSITDDEFILRQVTSGQTYYIRVYGSLGATNPDYTLEIDWPFNISQDSLETNDTFATAYNLGAGDQTHKDLTIHDETGEFVSNEDFYRWVANANGTLTVDAKFLHTLGNVELELYDSPTSRVALSYSTTDNERVTAAVSAGHAYYIRVFGFAGGIHPDYDLVIDGPEIFLDRLGDHRTFETAFDLGAGAQTHNGLSIHEPGADDWYKWRANAGGTLTIDVTFLDSLGDLDVALFDSQQTLLDDETSANDNEHLVYANLVAGETYFIRVYGYQGATNHNYNLQLTWPPAIAPDTLEPNDTMASARDLGVGDQQHEQLTIHSTSNEDWNRWTASTDGTLIVDVIFLSANGDVDIQLFDATPELLTESRSGSDDERLVWEVSAAQSYYLRIYGHQGATHPDYDLQIDGPDIPLDDLEANDAFAQARDLGMADQIHPGQTIHEPNNDDWLRWTAAANGTLIVTARFEHALGDLDLALHGADGAPLFAVTSSSDDEQLPWPVTAGETYYIRVYGFNGATQPSYELEVNGPEVPPDALEANDTAEAARSLPSGDSFHPGLTIHAAGNEDWYRWTAPTDGQLVAALDFAHVLGDLELELFDDQQQLLTASRSLTDGEQVSWNVSAGRDYLLRVYGARAIYTNRRLLGPAEPIVDTALQANYDLAVTLVGPPVVTGQRIFYNNSSFDGNDPAANTNDDAAIATDKVALLPGQTASFQNYTSYTAGINGIMIDIAAAPNPLAITEADFVFEVGTGVSPPTWIAAPTPAVTPRLGAGEDGSDRITIIWPDNAIQNQWLKVEVLATANTGLVNAVVVYWGNLIGDTGNSASSAVTDFTDLQLAFAVIFTAAAVDSAFDVNRSGNVDFTDLQLMFGNIFTALELLAAPSALPPSPLAVLRVGETETVADPLSTDLFFSALDSKDALLPYQHTEPWRRRFV